MRFFKISSSLKTVKLALFIAMLAAASCKDSHIAVKPVEKNQGTSFENTAAETECIDSVLAGYCLQNIASNERVYGITVADFNGDQIKDIFPHGHDEADEILFMTRPMSRSDGLATPFDRHGCDAADIDQDDDLDIYCAFGAQRGQGRFGNQLYLNDGKGNFEATPPIGAEDFYGRGRIALFFKYNQDHFPDLLVTNWGNREDEKENETKVYLNKNGKTFEALSHFSPGAIGAICALGEDFDQNGFGDLVLCERGGKSKIYFNYDGQFVDKTENLGVRGRAGLSWTEVRALDLNLDGKMDLGYVDTKYRLKIHFLNDENIFGKADKVIDLDQLLFAKFQVRKPKPPRGQIKFDFFNGDNDAHIDILVGTDFSLIEKPDKFLGNFVLHGPDFTRVTHLGEVRQATGLVKSYGTDAVIIASAMRDQYGEVNLLRLKETSD